MKTVILLLVLLSSCCNHESINIGTAINIQANGKNYEAINCHISDGCIGFLETNRCIKCGNVIELKEGVICGNFTIIE